MATFLVQSHKGFSAYKTKNALGNTITVFVKNVAEQRIMHFNAQLNGVRRVNQLITREKKPDNLIKDACKLLVEARGFDTVIIGLTTNDGKKVKLLAGSGNGFLPFEQQLEHNKMHDYVSC